MIENVVDQEIQNDENDLVDEGVSAPSSTNQEDENSENPVITDLSEVVFMKCVKRWLRPNNFIVEIGDIVEVDESLALTLEKHNIAKRMV